MMLRRHSVKCFTPSLLSCLAQRRMLKCLLLVFRRSRILPQLPLSRREHVKAKNDGINEMMDSIHPTSTSMIF